MIFIGVSFTGFSVAELSFAHAAGMWQLDRGASTFARGGANYAAPQDPNALYTNPAALSEITGLQLQLDGNMVFDKRTFLRTPDDNAGYKQDYDLSVNSWSPVPPSPGLFISYNFATLGLHGLTLAAGAYGPARADRSWLPDGAQRYNEIAGHNIQAHYSLGAAFAIDLSQWRIRLGASAMNIRTTVDSTLAYNIATFGVEDRDYDIDVELLGESSAWSGIAALSASPSINWTFAASYQLPFTIAFNDGTVALTPGEQLKEVVTFTGNKAGISIKMPAVARFAGRYDHNQKLFDIELALVWEGWSRTKALLFTPDNVIVDALLADPKPLDEQNIPYNYRDSYSIRLGGSYKLTEYLRVRSGLLFEKGAVAQEYLSAAAFDLDKVGFTGGTRVDLGQHYWIDLSAGYLFWLPKTVKNSKVLLRHPLDKTYIGPPTANGIYSNSQFIIMAALGFML